MVRRLLIALGALGLAACVQSSATPTAPIASATPSQEMLSRLVGRWVLTGIIAGEQTTHDVEASWTLNGQYVRIDEVSRERDSHGQPAYVATIFVGWLQDHYVCFWFDNTGVASPAVTCTAPFAQDTIAFEFRNAEDTLFFTNTFAYNRAADTWSWRMVDVEGGRTDTFGAVTLRRR